MNCTVKNLQKLVRAECNARISVPRAELLTTSSVAVWNTVFCVFVAIHVVMKNSWLSAANAAASVLRVVLGEWWTAPRHLVDEVLPKRSIQQWVLNVPYPLRYLFATHPAVMSQVLTIVHRTISTFLIKRARMTMAPPMRCSARWDSWAALQHWCPVRGLT